MTDGKIALLWKWR